jgi:HAD superfamily hydrolase (TIGR01509 family)
MLKMPKILKTGEGSVMCRYKAVIYDCDGVMFDSFEANFEFYSRIMARFDRMPLDRNDHDVMRVLHTYSNRDVMDFLFADAPCKQEALQFAGTIDYRELIPFMRMEPGFRETLDRLSCQTELAVCTNRSTSMEMLLAEYNLSSYFSCVMTAAQVTNPKPHPEPLLKVLAHYGFGPGETLFVGDSALDCQAAQAANVPFVAYKADLPCLSRIENHTEILDIIRL